MPPFVISCRVEFEDVDAYGIAHHSRLINFLERARVRFFHENNIDVHDGDFHLVLADLSVSFRQAAHMMDLLNVELSIEKLGSASLVWAYKLMRNDDLILEGKLKMASVDAQLKPRRFPREIKSCLDKLLT